MRTLRLARVAAEAEGLLLRRGLRRIAIRAALFAVALLFLIGAVAMLHIAFWLRMAPVWGPEWTALVLAAFDAAVAAIVAMLAARSPLDKAMTDAVAVRDLAMSEIRHAFTVSSMLKPLAGILLEQWMLRRGRKKE